MGMIGEILFWILKAVLPWLSSGSSTTEIHRVTGVNGLDRDSHVKDIVPDL